MSVSSMFILIVSLTGHIRGQLCTDLDEVIQAQYHQQMFSVLIPTFEVREPRCVLVYSIAPSFPDYFSEYTRMQPRR